MNKEKKSLSRTFNAIVVAGIALTALSSCASVNSYRTYVAKDDLVNIEKIEDVYTCITKNNQQTLDISLSKSSEEHKDIETRKTDYQLQKCLKKAEIRELSAKEMNWYGYKMK